ncbi:hypothetical protein PIB30_071315 [Stylosanthes scabra]|uniref:Putative plant transposon protein domain-containing protein n=1 Tax=Stylosanthes scabra TaxID=79078 RepID=A0ABU6XM42_9FABA|nr:hypothetical protein [Stylosanthes scabra]
MEEHGGHTYRSFVRGVPIDFSSENIRTVMRFRAQVQGATTDFETRKEHDQQLDRVLYDLCMPGATWKLSTGQQRVPIQPRRQELNPIAKGWHEFSIHSLIPSSNRSEIPVIRAILIHCIMKGEDVRAEDIVADKMVRMAQGIKEKGKLGFPSTIYKLCKEAGVPLRKFRRTKKIQIEKPITARRMESTRLPRPIQHQQQDDVDEDQPMPQAEEGNEEGNEEGQGYEHDYHHQPEFDHQPEYEHHQDFQEEPQVQQPPLYHVPTYTDQHEKDLHSIETQLQNMMWFYHQVTEKQREMAKEIQQVKNYQVNQTMVDSTRNKAILEELAAVKSRQEEFFSNHANQYNMIRQEQKLLGKEILDVKKYQMSAVTMGSGSSSSPTPQRYKSDQALMKIREQHANFSEMQRQLRDWTTNASARECYTVWAHQQANSNLVEMSSQKVVKQIYDNIDHKRPMFQGLLKSDLPPSDSAPPPSSSNDPKNPPK